MALPNIPFDPNSRIPNNPFYAPTSYFLEGEFGPFVIGSGLAVSPQGVLSATGGGGGGVTTITVSGNGITATPSVGNVVLSNTGVTRIEAGSGILLSGNVGDISISSTYTGTIDNIVAGAGLTGGGTGPTVNLGLSTSGASPGNYSVPTLTVDIYGRITAIGNGTAVTSVCGTLPVNVLNGATATPTISVDAATIANSGVVQLSNATNSTSISTAATSLAVSNAYCLASLAIPCSVFSAKGQLLASTGSSSPTALPAGSTGQALVVNPASSTGFDWVTLTTGSGSVTCVCTGTGLSGGPITTVGTIALINTGVTCGSYTNASITVDEQGRLLAASNGIPPVTAVTGSGPIKVSVGTAPVVSIDPASTITSGAVQLYDDTNSFSTLLALTANQGRVLQDQIDALLTTPGIDFAGTIDASTGFVSSVTTVGTAAGYTVAAVLPAADILTVNTYVIVTTPGTFTPPGGSPTTAGDGDWFLASETAPGVYSWQFLSVGFDAPYATTTSSGVVCLSTNSAAQLGTDATTALTPAAAASAYVPISCYGVKGNIIAATGACAFSALPAGNDGYFLTANSGATTGLQWVCGSFIPCSTVTGKGALVTGTASAAPTALTVGSDGQVLYADSTCTTGLCWGPAPITCLNFNATGDLLVGTGSDTFSVLSRGTNGDVLTVCSGCPTGLTWATASVPAIPCACLSAKGSLVTATAACTPSNLPVGGDGQILTACSASTNGLCWTANTAIPCSCITGKGALVTGTGANAPTALPVGTDGKFLVACSACPSGLTWGDGSSIVNLYPVIRNANYNFTIPSPNFTQKVICYNDIICDSTGWYNGTTGVFQPTVPGFYQISALGRVYANNTYNAEASLGLVCNGSLIGSQGSFGAVNGTLSTLVYMNGSTDALCVVAVIQASSGTNVLNVANSRFTALLAQAQVAPTQICGDTPVGAINWFGSTTAPSGWLVADGQAVSRTGYADLFAVIGTTYGSGDGSTTFNLPDLRGMFARGWDAAGGTARGCDPGRAFGSLQTSAFGSHLHEVNVLAGGAGRPEWLTPNNFCPLGATYPQPATGGPAVRSGGFTTVTGTSETRPINLALLPCIKWATTIAPANPSSCGIPCSTLVSKGTLVTASSANTPVALPVGNNGQVLVANSACSTGLQWQAGVLGPWISAGTVQSVGLGAIQTTTGAPQTAPTITASTQNNVRYRQIGFKEWEVQAIVNPTAGTTGNGDYILTLPAGLQFDLTSPYQQPYTTGPNYSIGWPGTGLINAWVFFGEPDGTWSSNLSTILPYDATRYRIVPWGPSFTNFWNSSYYTFRNANLWRKWGFTFTTP